MVDPKNRGIKMDLEDSEEDESSEEEESDKEIKKQVVDTRDEVMELKLWPEIKAMLVIELASLVDRFPCFALTQTASKGVLNLASDLMTKAIQDETFPLSPSRLEEITQIYEAHKILTALPQVSDMARDIIPD